MIRTIILAALALLGLSGAAEAGPVFFAALSAGASVGSAFAATTLGTFLTTTIAGRLITAVAMTELSHALQKKPDMPIAGIKTQTTAGGGTNPVSFILGRYATAGVAVCPAMSHGMSGKVPNAYLTYVIAISDMPGVTLNRLVIDGEYATVGGTAHPDYGTPVAVKGKSPAAWIKWYDGTQTVADPMLLSKYGSYPDRPWTSDMIGRGVTYAILTFGFDRQIFNSFPDVRFEVDGIPLYDPRKDDTAGGTGAQRWNNQATWAQTNNPMVMIYNIMRGVTLPDGAVVWGGGSGAADLPAAEWFAAMNACDAPVALAAGGTVPRYRAGYEVTVDTEPAAVIDELLKSCSGQVADIGGVWKPRAGGPGLPVYSFDDDGVIVSNPQDFDPFHGLDQTYNGVSATYPEPASIWEGKEAPPRYNAAYETADGGRRLIANLTLPAVPYGGQVQRLMRAYIEDERRFRRHVFSLPPGAAVIEPLDAVAWTSARNGYAAKVFEVAEVSDDLMTLIQTVTIRERDAADYNWSTGYELPSLIVTPTTVMPAAQTVPSWAMTGVALDDAGAVARRPALKMTWDGAGQDDVTALEYEIRRLGGAQVVAGVTTNVGSGVQIFAAGVLPSTVYEARARFVVGRPVSWTAWTQATTPAAYITLSDFSDFSGLFKAAGLTVPAIVGALPPPGPARWVGELVYLTTDNKLYRWDGSAWTAAVPTSDLTGLVAQSQLTIADTSNLVEDPGFELQGAGTAVSWGAAGMNGYSMTVYQGTHVRSGNYSALRTWTANGTFALPNSVRFDAAEGDQFRLSGWIKKATGAACAFAGVRMAWFDRDGALITTAGVNRTDANITTSYQRVTGAVVAPAGTVSARVELICNTHTAGTFYWDDIYCYRMNAGELTVDGTIFGNHIAANTITGGLIAASGIITQVAQIADAIITNAKIANATIQGAKIANLAVDTLQVADSAISTVDSAYTAGSVNISTGGAPSTVTVQSLVVNKGRSDPMIFHATVALWIPVGESDRTASIYLEVGGTTVATLLNVDLIEGVTVEFSLSGVDNTGTTGNRTLTLVVASQGSSPYLVASKRGLFAMNLLK